MVELFVPSDLPPVGLAVGEVVHLVRCDGCPREYVYRMRVSASSNSPGAGLTAGWRGDPFEAAAETALLRAVARASLPVPCPACGVLPSHMKPAVERGRRRRRSIVGASALVAGVAAFLAYRGITAPTPWEMERWFVGALGVLLAGAVIGVTAFTGSHLGNIVPRKPTTELVPVGMNGETVLAREAYERQAAERTATEFDRDMRSAQPRRTAGFFVPVWVSADQIAAGQSVPVRLPTGEVVPFALRPQMRNRDYLELGRVVSGRDVTFRCLLHVYHARPKWRPPVGA